MKRILLAAIFLAIMAAGCIEKEGETGSFAKASEESAEELTVTIMYPRSGEILQGNGDVKFDAAISGGKGPYTYRWSSNIDGTLSTKSSYQQRPSQLSKGEHIIILAVTDASGDSGQASVIIRVM